MTVLAAPGDTWGIPGPAFLALYLAAAALIVVTAFIYRTWVFAGRRKCDFNQLGPQQAAYLNGGNRLAVYASLGGLRSAGVIGVTPDRRLAVTGRMPAGITPLDQAVYNAAGNRVRARDLAQDPWVARALDDLGNGLAQRGLALSPGQRSLARLGPLLLLGLLLLGGLRFFAGVSNDKPTSLLLLSCFGVLVAMLIQMRVPSRTRAGRSALTQLRTRHSHLAPANAPAYAAYGAVGTAMGVALFGAATLWSLDPAFAAEAEIQRQATGSGSSGSSCSGGDSSSSDSGGGSSCGGGGCGG